MISRKEPKVLLLTILFHCGAVLLPRLSLYPQETSRTGDLQTAGSSKVDEGVILPSNTEISDAAKDLLRRLLQIDPKTRLKSIFGLQRIAFYMGHDIRSYVSKEISPLKLLGHKIQVSINGAESANGKIFQDFDMPR